MCFPTPKVWFAIRWLFWVRVTYDHVVISTKKMKIIQGKKCKNGKVWKTNDLREMHASFDLLFAILHRGHAWWRWFYFSHGIGAPASGPGPGSNGAMALFQVLEFNNETGANVVCDKETASVYSYSGSYWVGYDDPKTVAVKVGFAQALSLCIVYFQSQSINNPSKFLDSFSLSLV